jgi:hypothetical protein
MECRPPLKEEDEQSDAECAAAEQSQPQTFKPVKSRQRDAGDDRCGQ